MLSHVLVNITNISTSISHIASYHLKCTFSIFHISLLQESVYIYTTKSPQLDVHLVSPTDGGSIIHQLTFNHLTMVIERSGKCPSAYQEITKKLRYMSEVRLTSGCKTITECSTL